MPERAEKVVEWLVRVPERLPRKFSCSAYWSSFTSENKSTSCGSVPEGTCYSLHSSSEWHASILLSNHKMQNGARYRVRTLHGISGFLNLTCKWGLFTAAGDCTGFLEIAFSRRTWVSSEVTPFNWYAQSIFSLVPITTIDQRLNWTKLPCTAYCQFC